MCVDLMSSHQQQHKMSKRKIGSKKNSFLFYFEIRSCCPLVPGLLSLLMSISCVFLFRTSPGLSSSFLVPCCCCWLLLHFCFIFFWELWKTFTSTCPHLPSVTTLTLWSSSHLSPDQLPILGQRNSVNLNPERFPQSQAETISLKVLQRDMITIREN